jgi:hypothetical protein
LPHGIYCATISLRAALDDRAKSPWEISAYSQRLIIRRQAMKKNILSAALLVSSALAMGALASSATAAPGFGLKPGNYDLGGMQQVCLRDDRTWYSETFAAWGGNWFVGPSAEDGTLIFGHYDTGAGSDSIVVSKGTADWMEWDTNTGSQVFFDGIKVTSIKGVPGKCTPPATKVTPGHHNPMD